MSRYIDAEELKLSLLNFQQTIKNLGYPVVSDIIDKFPAADVEEVRHGEWVKSGRLEGKVVMKCSVCSQGITSMFAPEYHYCPNCGAKMDGGKE